jgi:hypothetical protein
MRIDVSQFDLNDLEAMDEFEIEELKQSLTKTPIEEFSNSNQDQKKNFNKQRDAKRGEGTWEET